MVVEQIDPGGNNTFNSMAFPIPSHLPRQQDVSSKILTKIDEATAETLNASLASSWVAELDETIQLTKVWPSGLPHLRDF